MSDRYGVVGFSREMPDYGPSVGTTSLDDNMKGIEAIRKFMGVD